MYLYMGKESSTLQYKIAQEGYDVIDLGVNLLPKTQTALITRGRETVEVPLRTKECYVKRNGGMMHGTEVAVEIDTPFEQSLCVPLFYFADYSFLGIPTPDLRPEVSEKMIRPDRTVTRVKDQDTLQQAMNLVTILRTSLHCQQAARMK